MNDDLPDAELCDAVRNDLMILLADVAALRRPELRGEALQAECERIHNRVVDALEAVKGNRSPETPTTYADLRFIVAAYLRVLLSELEGEPS